MANQKKRLTEATITKRGHTTAETRSTIRFVRRSLLVLSAGLILSSLPTTGAAESPAVPEASSPKHDDAKKIVRIDRAHLAGEDLKPLPPYPSESLIAGESRNSGHTFWEGEMSVKVTSNAPANYRIDPQPFDEFIYILEGELTLIDIEGQKDDFGVGDWLVLPRGWRGTWETRGNYRELLSIETRSLHAGMEAIRKKLAEGELNR
jgi:uncharacterized cupin superfamily protein